MSGLTVKADRFSLIYPNFQTQYEEESYYRIDAMSFNLVAPIEANLKIDCFHCTSCQKSSGSVSYLIYRKSIGPMESLLHWNRQLRRP